MGLRRFDARVSKPQQARGRVLPEGTETQVSWTPQVANSPGKDVYVFLNARTDASTPPRVVFGSDPSNVHWTPLVDGWWCARVGGVPAAASSLSIRAEESGLLLANIVERTGAICRPVGIVSPANTETVPLPAFIARWARNQASLLLPAPSGVAVNLFVLMRLSSDQPAGAQAMSLNGGPALPADLTPGIWEWRVLPLPQETRSNNVACIAFTSSLPWRSGIKGYRDDLVAMMGAAVMRPEEPSYGQTKTQ
jgi:hypothetical protein